MDNIKLRKENAYLKKALDELARQKKEEEPLDSENNKLLLQRILSLETLREKHSQQLMSKGEEIASLKNQLRMTGGDLADGLQAQIEHYHRDAEHRERLFQSLQLETEEVKNKLVAVSAKCQELESQAAGLQSDGSDGQASSSTSAVLHNHLRDALEKNQEWLAYDQQREAYVKVVLARVFGLEQQLNQAKQALSVQQQHTKDRSDEKNALREMQEYYERLLSTARKELESYREQINTAHKDLNDLQWRCEEGQREADEAKQLLQAERLSVRKSAQEEKGRCGDRESRLRAEAEELQNRLEEERHRSAELQHQVNLLQKSVLSHHKDQEQISVLEQQIQVSFKDLEDEKRDCQYLQKQLHKVLRELRKAKDHVAKLDSKKARRDSSPNEAIGPSRAPPSSPPREKVASPPRHPNQLEESFLECPSCLALYPTSHHRELLAHLENCLV
ncbi:centrosomal protein of 55 kDa-like [Aplochiton taeniatus]